MFSRSLAHTAKWCPRIDGIAVPLRKPARALRSSFAGLTSVGEFVESQCVERQAEDAAVLANLAADADVVIPLAG
jgi:hypothetical protein